jgi:membrane associated rhomboid family serine protease
MRLAPCGKLGDLGAQVENRRQPMTDPEKDEQIPAEQGRQPIFMLPPLIVVLAGLMLAIQAGMSWIFNEDTQQHIYEWLAFVPARLLVPDQFAGGLTPLIWTPLTYGFLHGGWEHVLGNVAWLVIFGTPVARRYGVVRTLVIFFVSSAIGALAFAITEFDTAGYLVGASGGIAGLTGAAMRFIFQPVIVAPHPETGEPVALGRRMASLPEILRSGPARNFSIIWIVLNCLVPLAPLVIGQDVGIAWQAHLGGFFTGLLLVPFFDHSAREEAPSAKA